MRENLRGQFGTLRALSELDQCILTATDLQTVIETALRRMMVLFECQCASVTVVDKDAEDVAQVIWTSGDGQFEVDRIQLSVEHRLAETDEPICIAHA